MKRFIFFACIFTAVTGSLSSTLLAQEPGGYPNYVVIGAFAHEENAVAFTQDANAHQFPARFEMNYNRNLYYVFVLTTADRERAFDEALKLRSETKYWDTWVFSGPFGQTYAGDGAEAHDFNPVTREKIVQVNGPALPGSRESIRSSDVRSNAVTSRVSLDGDQRGANTSANRRREDDDTATDPAEADHELVTSTSQYRQSEDGSSTNQETDSQRNVEARTAAVRPIPRKVNDAPLTAEEVVGKDFYFQLYRADNGAWVEGEIDAVDVERSRKMATYQANTPVKVILPSGKSKQVSFVCQVFGYRKQQVDFDPAHPSDAVFLDEHGNLVVPFELVRLQKGDIAIMYNVFFFKDAAVMRPESRYEVNNLLELLQENPSYNIRIHGHTNGNANGKIIRKEPGSDNFYSLANTKQGVGSAKKLSEERALVIRDFLVSSGIAAGRMDVKAWGGKKPIHDKNSARAAENVRVEIEILSE